MFRTIFIICGCLFVLSGCVANEEPTAEIVYTHPIEINPVRPPVVEPTPVPNYIDRSVPRSWYPPRRLERKWEAIIVHHSATNNGNAAIFDQVEVTFRWRGQLAGAHCKTPHNWGNEKGIGICLVGNFDRTSPTVRQMQSLVRLVQFLQKRYGIPKRFVYGHGTTPGARVTDCPGRRFPMAWMKSKLSF
jgi:hypothetical protein